MALTRLLPLEATGYRRHPLHEADRIWTETNCYVDLWIELLHCLGVEPLAASAFGISAGFEGDQWTFFKFPPEDLRAVYGIEVAEMNVWRPVLDHVVEQLELGRLLTVEVDARFLPDTAGVSYHLAHAKSTIVANMVDTERRELGYFHNAGYYELAGDDFDGVFRLGTDADPGALPPYVEMVKLDRLRRDEPAALAAAAERLLAGHAARAPATNPMPALAARISADLDWLRAHDLDDFHLWTFGICRQCGASAELSADFLNWLAARGRPRPDLLRAAADSLRGLAESAKALQFSLARLARGRNGDLSPILDSMHADWQAAHAALAARQSGVSR